MTFDVAVIRYDTRSKATKKKIDKMGFIKIKNVCIHEHYQESEATTHRMEENL